MKKLICLLALPFLVAAGEVTQERCVGIHGLAEQVMDARQSGVPVTKMMEIGANDDVMKALVMMAYKKPMFSVESNKKESISEFANSVFLECMALVGDDK